MKKISSHIIRKQSIEINFEDPGDSFGLQNTIAEIFYEKLYPEIEVLFNEMFGEHYFASLDRLEIDCGILSHKNWEAEFVEQTLRKLKEELNPVDKKKINSDEVIVSNVIDSFIFFLENGYMPWNSRTYSIKEIEQNISFDEKFIRQLKELIRKKEIAAERLVSQFSEGFVEKIIQVIAGNNEERLKTIISHTEKYSQSPTDKKFVLIEILKQLAEDSDLKVIKMEEKKPDIKEEPETETEAIYIENAGLVILHPFLPELFENIGYLEKNEWLSEEVRQRAIALTQYMVKGNVEYPEFDMMLNKIICGYEINKTLPVNVELSEFEKREADDLLESVIKHWSALKNTSAEGLRNTFLLRNGKLVFEEREWLLKIEQKTVDILLNKLPWGIGMIKLPWMKEMLRVEWN